MRGLWCKLNDKLPEDIKKVMVEAEPKGVQQYEVDLTVDPDTAHSDLILSDDGKQIHHGNEKKNLPPEPQTFSIAVFLIHHNFLCAYETCRVAPVCSIKKILSPTLSEITLMLLQVLRRWLT